MGTHQPPRSARRRGPPRATLALRVDEPVRAYLRAEAQARGCTPSEVARAILSRHIAGEERTVATLRRELLQGLDTLGKRLEGAVSAAASWEARETRIEERSRAVQGQLHFVGQEMEAARQTLEATRQEVAGVGEELARARRRLPWQVWAAALALGVLPVAAGALYLATHSYGILDAAELQALTTGVRFQIAYTQLPPAEREQVRSLLHWDE
ncbi:MAG: hypothetical protein IH608_00465 [Proteobacteria bacterium]|nr:hypothetical protein [Pseudomonadota bacterium]